MPRLPTPGGDNGVWGFILNEFLEVEHQADGKHLDATASQRGVMRLRRDLGNNAANPYVVGLQGRNVASTAPAGGNVLTWNSSNSRWQPQIIPEATAGVSGILRLTNDFGGTATSPLVTGIQGRSVANTAPSDGEVLTWNNTASQWEPQAGGGGGGAPTLVVAASDASAESQAKADFVCTGTDDHLVIQSALDQMDTGFGLGGRLLLTEGTFNCSYGAIRTSDVTAQGPMHIQGVGNATRLSFTGGPGIGIEINSEDCIISDLWIQGNDVNNVGGISTNDHNSIITRVKIERIGSSGAGIFLEFNGDRARVVDNLIESCLSPAIQMTAGATEVVIADNDMRANNGGIDVVGNGAVSMIVSDNTVVETTFGIRFGSTVSTQDVTISGNVFNGSPSDNGIHLDSGPSSSTTITGNVLSGFINGVALQSQQGIIISSNSISSPSQHGISITDSSNCTVTGNMFLRPGDSVDNTYDGIFLSGNSDGNQIEGNKVIGNLSSPQPRYGINISASTCDNNVINDNDFGSSGDYGTGFINDTGTGTLIGSNAEWNLDLPSARNDSDVVSWDSSSQKFIMSASGGGGGTPTLVVAASNATAESQSKADYVCTGTNDHTVIQTAIDALPFQGGRILFTEGEFHPDWDQIKLPNSGQVTLEGVGMSTIFDMNDTNPTTGTGPVFEVVAGTGHCQIRDMQIWGPSNGTSSQVAIRLAGGFDKVSNVLIDAFEGNSIEIVTGGSDSVIESCQIQVARRSCITITGDTSGHRIANNYLEQNASAPVPLMQVGSGGQNISIVGNDMRAVNTAVELAGDNDNCSINDNQMFSNEDVALNIIGTGHSNIVVDGNVISAESEGINCTGDVDGLIITSNTVTSGTTVASAGINIASASTRLAIIQSNTIRDTGGPAISLANCQEITVDGNQISDPEQHGIRLNAVMNSKLVNNHIIRSGQVADNTYDGIFIEGDSNQNDITDNRIIGSSTAPQPRYGINISASTCDNNVINDNDFGSSGDYGTGFINDTGTGTLIGSNAEWNLDLPSARNDSDVVSWDSSSQKFIMSASGGGGGGAPTYVIAASNALDVEKDKADFVCDGTDDQVEIQQALNQLLVGGRLLLTSGTFNISFNGSANCITSGGFSGFTIQGMGTEATIFNVTDSFGGIGLDHFAFECTDADIGFHSLTIQGGDGVNGPTGGIALGAHCVARDVIINLDGTGILLTDGISVVDNCEFLGAGNGVEANADGCIVTNSHFYHIGGIGVSSTSVWGGITITNNYFAGNDGGSSIYTEGNRHSIVVDNVISQSDQHGIQLVDTEFSTIQNNMIISPGSSADNTYDGIILSGNSDGNHITGNRITGRAASPQPRYGINISAATCDNNSYLGNRSGPAADYASGAYNDAGTGTVNTWPGAAAPQGDNLL